MAHLLLCFRPQRRSDEAGRPTTSLPRVPPTRLAEVHHTISSDSGVPMESQRTVAYVELLKRRDEPLGLVLKGGADINQPIFVGQLHPGGVAQKSGALEVGDHIRAINGTATDHLNQNEANSLLRNSGNVINLEIEFDAPQESDVDTLKKTTQVRLKRERNGFGFTISGGRLENRPITVSNVIVGSYPYKNGFLKAGDRILKINSNPVAKATLSEAIAFLKSSEDACTLEVEYDVTIHEGLSEYRGQLMVELLKPKGASLGLTLREPTTPGGALVVSKLKEAGIADRCGALHVGDRLLSVNKEGLEGKTINEVYRMLRRCDLTVELEIIPAHNFTPLSQGNSIQRAPENPSDTASTLSQSCSQSHASVPVAMATAAGAAAAAAVAAPSQISAADSQSVLSFSSMATSHVVATHPETMKVGLEADVIGFGLSLQGGATERGVLPLVISAIVEGGPAARLGQLQVGDQVLGINGVQMAGYTLQEALKLVQEAENVLDLEIMYDVRDAAPPSSGSFEVHLKKTGSLNLGVTINGSMSRGDTIWISSLKKGGVAYRSGMLQPGDAILSINGQSLEQRNLREAAQILKDSGDSVVVRVSKDSAALPRSPSSSDTVIFSVVLPRNQSSLGITLKGSSDQPGHPVVIDKIKENGVAHKTGALRVGNRILAINGESLYNKTLREALQLLHSAGDTVTLKISKATRKIRQRHKVNPTGKLKMHYPGSSHQRDLFNGHRMNLQPSRLHDLPMGGIHPSSSSTCWTSRCHHHRPSNAFDGRFLTTPTLGESASGYNTPDNDSLVSVYPPVPANFLPYGANSPQQMAKTTTDRPRVGVGESSFAMPPSNGTASMVHNLPWQRTPTMGRSRGEEDQRSLSEFSQRSSQWAGVHQRHGYSQTFNRALAVQDFQHSAAGFQHRRNTFSISGSGGGGATCNKRDSSTDDEMSAYEMEGRMPRLRKTSLPEPPGNGFHQQLMESPAANSHRVTEGGGGAVWDFRRGSSAFKSHIPVVRVSPITPAETDKPIEKALKDGVLVKPFPGYHSDTEESSQLPRAISSPDKDRAIADKQEEEEESKKQYQLSQTEANEMQDSTLRIKGVSEEVPHAQDENMSPTLGGTKSHISATLQTPESLETSDGTHETEPPPPMVVSSRPPSRRSHSPDARGVEFMDEVPPFAGRAEVLEVNGSSSDLQDQVEATPNVVGPILQLREIDPQYDSGPNDEEDEELEEIEESRSIEEPMKKPRNIPSRKHSRSSLRSADYPGNSADSRVLPIAHASAFISSSPPARVNSAAFRSHPVIPNSISSSSPHKQDSDVRLKRRDRHDHSPSRRSTTSSPLGMKGSYGHMRSSNHLPPILNEYQNTIDKADKFERAIAALAESGSSDQDSDSEPHSRLTAASLHPQEVARVTEKMRAPPSMVKQQVFIRKESGEVSFGFSIADGQFDTGVYVKTVKPGGPSDRGGLQQYDKIIKVNDVQLQHDHSSPYVYELLKSQGRAELVLTVTRQAQLAL